MKNSKNFKVMATVVALLFLATSFIVMMGCGGGGGGVLGGSSSNLGVITGTVPDSSSDTLTRALLSL